MIDSFPIGEVVRRTGLETVLLAYKNAVHFGVGPPLLAAQDVPAMITMFGSTKAGIRTARVAGRAPSRS